MAQTKIRSGTIKIQCYQNSGGNESIMYNSWSFKQEMITISKIA